LTSGRAALLLGSLLAGRAGAADAPPQAKHVYQISNDRLSQREFLEAVEPGSRWRVPGLRALLANSVAFDFAHSHAPWTTPSHVSMLTGQYPAQHGWNLPYVAMLKEGIPSPLEGRYRSIADYARDAGVATVAETGSGSVAARFGLGQGFQSYREHARDHGNALRIGRWEVPVDARRVWRSLAATMRERRGGRLFAFVHSYDFHSGPGDETALDFETGSREREHLKILEWIDAELVSPLLQAARDQGLYDDSLIVLTGDHGANMLRKDRKLLHRGVGHYEENLHVPLVLKFPKSWRAGTHVAELARHVDLLPTILGALGASYRDYKGPGRPLTELVLGQPRPEIVSWSEDDGHTFPRQSLILGRYKYIRMSEDPRVLSYLFNPDYSQALGDVDLLRRLYAFPPRDEELYDLAADPWETDNLAGRQAVAGLLESMRLRMKRLVEGFPRLTTTAKAKSRSVDPKTLEALRALGYIR
jgi:arylsulfatase A-like enzyme